MRCEGRRSVEKGLSGAFQMIDRDDIPYFTT